MVHITDFEADLAMQAERLCLEFANTVNWHASDNPIEELPTYPALLSWATRIGLLTEPEAQPLLRRAARHPDEALAALERAHNLREAIYRLLSAVAHARAADQADLDRINAELPPAMAHAQLAATPGGFVLNWVMEPDALDRVLWPITYSAADLLSTPDSLARVGQCADQRGCGWLFLDLTKNHSRRWCDMKDCGNRAKARRHYEKQRAMAL